MRPRLLLSLALLASCATNDVRGAGEPCGPSTGCARGYRCDPTALVCVVEAATPDAGLEPDAPVVLPPDAAEPDAPLVLPDAAEPDAPLAVPPDAAEPDAPPPPDAALPDATPPDATPPDARVIPVVTINSPASGATTGARVTLSFTAIPPAAAFTCSVDGGSAAPCGTGSSGTFDLGALDLAGGTHTATVRTLDGTGAPVGAGASVSWLIERSGPIFTIDKLDTQVNNGTVVVTYHASEPTATRACALDGHPCETCTQAGASCGQASAGLHVFTVAGVDPLGNAGAPTSSSPVQVTYGPNEGRVFLIGMDYDQSNASADLVLHRAFEQVPFRHQKPFDRKLRVTAYRQDTVAQSSVVHAWAAVSDLADLSSYREFHIPGELPTALAGSDVLLVYDQQDPTNLDALGIVWEPTLRAFADAGGIIVVLDGLGPTLNTQPSGTYQVVAEPSGQDHPLIAVGSVSDFTKTGQTQIVPFQDDAAASTGEPSSPLDVGSFDVPKTALVYDLADDPEQPLAVMGASVPDPQNEKPPTELPIVIQKIFPTYELLPDLPPALGPRGVFYFSLRPRVDHQRIDCAVRNVACNRTGTAPPCRCTSGSGCPCEGDEISGFSVPSTTSGSYVATVRLVDPYGRIGRIGSAPFSIDLPKVSLTPSPMPFGTHFGVFCYHGTTSNGRNLGYTLLFDGIEQSRDSSTDSSCASNDSGSFTFYVCATSTHTFEVRAADSYGNTSSASTSWFEYCFF